MEILFLTGFYIKLLWNDIRFVINRAETLRFSEEISTCIFLILSLILKELGSHEKESKNSDCQSSENG